MSSWFLRKWDPF